ncbi:hypothetical protein GY45DRAFT_871830 [Cubamyces sp. BRFM 1775]|nr:hypothetical protein GY45DRAFT_871830 [Cubamyces sp. BRFM 1775]
MSPGFTWPVLAILSSCIPSLRHCQQPHGRDREGRILRVEAMRCRFTCSPSPTTDPPRNAVVAGRLALRLVRCHSSLVPCGRGHSALYHIQIARWFSVPVPLGFYLIQLDIVRAELDEQMHCIAVERSYSPRGKGR